MWNFLVAHQVMVGMVLFWIFSAGVSSMPEPTEHSGTGYIWLYRFAHALAANLSTALSSKFSGKSNAAAAGK